MTETVTPRRHSSGEPFGRRRAITAFILFSPTGAAPGTGLGPAIVKSILNLHHSTCGCVFFLYSCGIVTVWLKSFHCLHLFIHDKQHRCVEL